MITMFVVEGGLIYLDKAEHGGFAAYEDGFTLLELCRNYYRGAGPCGPPAAAVISWIFLSKSEVAEACSGSASK